MSETIKRVVTPNDKTIRSVFGQSKSFFIDIYQREYRWIGKQVEALLNDIEMRFNLFPRTKSSPQEIQTEVNSNFDPYYVNTFLTHATVDSLNLSIIDGQQRLTTFLLILIKLYHIAKDIEITEGEKKTFSAKTLEKLIFEEDDFGNPAKFKIYNESREAILKLLIKDNTAVANIDVNGETQTRLKANYIIISKYYDNFFTAKETSSWDISKLTYYIAYFLDKIAIVEIKIEQQKDIAMIFEVVNDRGLQLMPYEILKGKLIGNLSERQKEEANTIWSNLQDSYYNVRIENSSESSKISLDDFFKSYLRAKFAHSEKDYERFEGEYHYEMIYRNDALRKYFGEFQDTERLFRIINTEIKYFAELYLKLRTTYDYEYLIYNKLLDQNQQTLLIISAISLEDPNCEQKIELVAKKFDQLHVILRLLDAYNSRAFQRIIYPLLAKIREKSTAEIASAFDNALLNALFAEGKIVDRNISVSDIFQFELFSNVYNSDTNFSKYILMRIDRYLAQLLDKPSYSKDGSLRDLEGHFNKTGRKTYGMHLEHIIANNQSNIALFTDANGVFDSAKYNETRNKLGAVLLLKDRQNESSNNALYRKKFTEYGQSNFIWNECLVGDLHAVDNRNLPPWGVSPILPAEDGTFPLAKIPDRQKAIYNAIKTIWNF